ncbi:winged helix-turn-helix domain-containing protein [Pseudoroseicyclus aestuarii]|uniref:Winged helix DNA-binding protein n=1 Tax=Pseudoroseicyclus aestuarii TaxID=1795041 RepID=A0A318SZR9_9RHOB|nr:crosslink repair DNA glycosylase YcaQ family protein [Pseudoroseicyclus aestuarii]PYE85869.1 hypothetical protein DFP88_101543 [Pseudoroseicyclus aestuarii]
MARTPKTAEMARRDARRHWIAAQRLDRPAPFGAGAGAVAACVAHLGYVQIDTISVIERCHHHILWSRIPDYTRADLAQAQSRDRSVFEYWTHALSYVATQDFRYFVPEMRRHRREAGGWDAGARRRQIRAMLNRIEAEGPLTLSDIKDDRLVEKTHAWASRKPSRTALRAGFFNGELAISAREGMLKTHELTLRHFGWEALPKPATPAQITRYKLERALRSQGIISLASACYMDAAAKPDVLALIEREGRAGRLVELRIEGLKDRHWCRPEVLEVPPAAPELVHILSPFDPLIIQRKRTEALLGYAHLFEAYVPKEKRQMGYFTLPVLDGDAVIAALDLKADRQAGRLLIQAWHWTGPGGEAHRPRVEAALERFEHFQLG